VTEKLEDQNNAKAWFVGEVCLKNYRTKIIPESDLYMGCVWKELGQKLYRIKYRTY